MQQDAQATEVAIASPESSTASEGRSVRLITIIPYLLILKLLFVQPVASGLHASQGLATK